MDMSAIRIVNDLSVPPLSYVFENFAHVGVTANNVGCGGG